MARVAPYSYLTCLSSEASNTVILNPNPVILNLFQDLVSTIHEDLRTGYVYILTNTTNLVLYIGLTSDLSRRISEHKQGVVQGCTKKYRTHKLVYCECSDDIAYAMQREKQLKNWHREWKKNLISEHNPEWRDLSGEL